MTDVGFGHLSNLSNLKTLWIGGTRITDAGAIHLSRLSKLERLGIQGTRITDAGLLHLKNAPNLNMLLVDNTSISPAGLQALKNAKAGNGPGRKSARRSSRTAQSSRAAHFRPLFNHKDLAGWTFPFGGDSEWKVENNTLVGSATNPVPEQSRHMIRTVGSHYKNFRLRMKVRSADQINKWFVFRLSGSPDNMSSYRFDTGGEKGDKTIAPMGRYGVKTGGVPGTQFGTEGLTSTTEPADPPLSVSEDFHNVELIVENNEFQMVVDGKPVSAFRDDLSRFPSGAIAMVLGQGARIEIRDIEVEELHRANPE